jgi:hypothetical protein
MGCKAHCKFRQSQRSRIWSNIAVSSDLSPSDELFPRVRAAMAAFEPAFRAAQASRKPERGQDGHYPALEMVKWNNRHLLAENTEQSVVEAYASELLPEILGGEWQTTDTTLREPPGTVGRRPVYSDYIVLFDHPLSFRRRGARGPSTWDNWAIAGRPYNTFDKDGSVKAESRNLAAHLAAQYRVGVWARPDLSAWFPGSTRLVVAARGLNTAEAARFGFVVLADGAPRP